MTATLEQVNDLASRIMAAQRTRRTERHRKLYTPRSTTASTLAYRCDRRLVYARTQPHYAEPPSDELCSIFEEGDLHQADVRKELLDLGFEAIRAEEPFRDDDLEIGGKIDGMIALTDEHRAPQVPVEIKSYAGDPPTTQEELRDHGGLLGRYFGQLQVYLYLTAKQVGMFLFKAKVTGLWTIVPVELDYEYVEVLLQRAERVRDYLRADTLPDRIADRSECPACPFRSELCHPEQASVDPLLLVNDKDLLGKLNRREHLHARAREFKRIDTEVKERFKLTAGTRFVVGDMETGFYVRKKESEVGATRLDIRRMVDVT